MSAFFLLVAHLGLFHAIDSGERFLDRDWQAAQVMPDTASVTVLVAAQAGALKATARATAVTSFFS
jgi:hypothetical protein